MHISGQAIGFLFSTAAITAATFLGCYAEGKSVLFSLAMGLIPVGVGPLVAMFVKSLEY